MLFTGLSGKRRIQGQGQRGAVDAAQGQGDDLPLLGRHGRKTLLPAIPLALDALPLPEVLARKTRVMEDLRLREVAPHVLFDQAAARADEVQPGLRAFLSSELDYLESGVWPKHLPDGVIHADLFNDNVFFLGDKLSGLIDFTFACNDWLAYDVAICLNAWCFEPDHSFNVTKARAFLNAYGRERKLSADEEAALPLLARGAAIRFLLTRLVDWLNVPPGALVRPKDPLEYVRKLRFHQSVASVRDYGLMPSGCVA